MSTSTTQSHIGNKISRIRELRGMKQETLAVELGVSQQTVSNIERSASVEDDVLAQVAKILGVTPEAIEKFSEEAVFNIMNNTFRDSSSNNNNYLCTINPLDKIIELYERLLEGESSIHQTVFEREKVILLRLETLYMMGQLVARASYVKPWTI